MKHGDRICYQIPIKTLKEYENYTKRQDNHIDNTPKIIVGKLNNNILQIWTDILKTQSVNRLKQLNSNPTAFLLARKIIVACTKLAPLYGYFILNENMIFFNQRREIYAWINPDILENNVKIYLPNSQQGQSAMIRSIVMFIRVWLKCDCRYLGQAQNLRDLVLKFDYLGNKSGDLKPFLPKNMFGFHKHSIPFYEEKTTLAKQFSNRRITDDNRVLYDLNRVNKGFQQRKLSGQGCQFTMSMGSKFPYLPKIGFDQTSQKEFTKNLKTWSRTPNQTSTPSYEHKTFNSTTINFDCFSNKTFNTSNVNYKSTKLKINDSQGVRTPGNYFPNKTTSNKSHPIVQLINSINEGGDEYRENRILISDDKHQQEERKKRLKESLDNIGQEINELFSSNMESQDNKEEETERQKQFCTLLE